MYKKTLKTPLNKKRNIDFPNLDFSRIQTFPDNFIFKGSKISQQQQIGNAVPPLLAEKIAECIIEMNNDAS